MKMHIEELLKEKKEQLTWLKSYAKGGKIVEFGCGSGFVIDILSDTFVNSIIVGVDRSMNNLKKVIEKDHKNVIPVQGDITHTLFHRSTIDTALFVDCLHVVSSYQGKEKVHDAIRMAHNVLKVHGVLLIHDFLRPPPRLVDIRFKNEQSRNTFLRFAKEFRPRRIAFEETTKGVRLEIADATDFIRKYRSPTESWKEEMEETHFFFTEKEYQETIQQRGFVIENSRTLPSYQKRWYESTKGEIVKDIEFTFDIECNLMQLVLKKKSQ